MAKKAAPKKSAKRTTQKKPAPRKAVKKSAAKKTAKLTKSTIPAENRAETGKPAIPIQERGIETRFQAGVSGNPHGRPRTKPLSDAYRALLNKKDPNDKEGRTYAEVIAMAQVKKAIDGDPRAVAEIADRVEGKVTQPVSGPDEGPIDVRLSNLTPEERDAKMAEVAARLGFRRD